MNKAREIYKDTILDCLLCVNGDFSKCNQNNNTSLKSYLSFNLVWLTGAIDKETSGCVLALQKQLLRLAEFFFLMAVSLEPFALIYLMIASLARRGKFRHRERHFPSLRHQKASLGRRLR